MKKGKGVCVKENGVKQGGEKSRERGEACMETKEDRNMWVVGRTLKGNRLDRK